jgi:hypothetical protein
MKTVPMKKSQVKRNLAKEIWEASESMPIEELKEVVFTTINNIEKLVESFKGNVHETKLSR